VGSSRQPYPGIEEKVLALVRDAGLLDRVAIMAFEDDTVRRVRTLEPRVRTVLLLSRTRAERAANAREIVRLVTAVGATDLGIDYRALSAEVIAAARAARVRVAAWTVNEEADIRRVVGLGVDVVISDRPDLVMGSVRGAPAGVGGVRDSPPKPPMSQPRP
jgi:glycerophosphoryl diester phosphodiesterase